MDNTNTEESHIADDTQRAGSAGCGFWLFWLFATVVGSGLGWYAGWWVSFQVPGELGAITLGTVMGLVLGFAQWVPLRGYLPGAVWWVASSMLGWGIGFFGGVYLAESTNLVELRFTLFIGAAVGLSTGVAQWLVLRRVSSYAGWWVLASLFSWTSAFIYYQAGLSLRGAFFGLLVGILTGWALIGILNFPGSKQTS